jgi:hypothetical protein
LARLRHEQEKKLRDPQDVLIEADRLRQQLKKRRGTPTKERFSQKTDSDQPSHGRGDKISWEA